MKSNVGTCSVETFTHLYTSGVHRDIIAEKCNCAVQTIKNRASRLKLSREKNGTIDIEHKTKEDVMKKRTLRQDRRTLEREENVRATARNYKKALKYIEELELHLDAKGRLERSKRTHIIRSYKKKSTDEATAVACLSDVHIGERITPEQVNGLNEYSMAIAKQRLDKYFSRIVKLTDKERQDVHIDNLVLFLGGDIIDGALHLDTIMSNETPEIMKQAVTAQSHIRSGLHFLEKHFKNITVICKDGNHGRVTYRVHHSSRQGNSLEWYMFHNLAHEFPQFTWINEHALHTYMTFYKGQQGEKTVRFHHGDTIHFGGVNGPYTYLNRRRYQWNAGKRADIDVIGHLHMYRVNPNGWVLNGSVVGYNPFAVSLGAEYERPQQAFFLMDKHRGMTVNIPILFD